MKKNVLQEAYLLLGTNLGKREQNLENARRLINERAGSIIRKSGIYVTEPWGMKEQPEFLNQIVMIETCLSPEDLLTEINLCENEAGRVRQKKWGERILDIDILYYANEIIVRRNLKIPHPEIQNRRFTLTPLSELAPDYLHPVLNVSNKALLERCKDVSEVRVMN